MKTSDTVKLERDKLAQDERLALLGMGKDVIVAGLSNDAVVYIAATFLLGQLVTSPQGLAVIKEVFTPENVKASMQSPLGPIGLITNVIARLGGLAGRTIAGVNN